jgi:GT2 family glycosyltransferase
MTFADGDATILVCEPAGAEPVLRRALDLRRAGVHFLLSVHVEDVRDRLIRERSADFCATYATWDEVRLILDEFASSVASGRSTIPAPDSALLVEAIRLSDAVLVRSGSERARLLDTIGSVERDVEIVVDEDLTVPAGAAGEPTDVVVFAPLERADGLAAFVTALYDLELPVTVVARDAPTIAGRVRFELPERAAVALGRARVIVDAGNDPGVALALAKLGRPLVVSAVGGAAEALSGAWTYDIWRRRSILAAVANALGAPPPVRRPGYGSDRPPRRAQPVFDADAPLVSVIVPTHNRPALLAETLTAIERQTYPALEIVVVNDAGADVREVVARFPRARLLNQPENRGPAAARNRGLADARGTFVTFFDDDDEMFPDHIAALANAALRSGLDVAYGQMINCFVTATTGGQFAIDGFAAHDALMDHADIQWAGALATTALLFRRSLAERIGTVDESLIAAEDYEFWLRLAAGRDWARVADVTSIYFVRRDGSNRSAVRARRYFAAHQVIYAKHPTSRLLVLAGRYSMLELFNQTAAPPDGPAAAGSD